MLKRWIPLLLVVGLLLPSVVGAVTPTYNDFLMSQGTVNVMISPQEHYAISLASLDTTDRIYVEIETITGDFNFFICDAENYNLYLSGYSITRYNALQNRVRIDVVFNIPNSGHWYVVFENSDSTFTTHIQGWVGLVPQSVGIQIAQSQTMSIIALILVLSVVVVSLGICKLWMEDEKEKEVKRSQYMPYQTDLQPSSSATQPVIGPFCPFCGTVMDSRESQSCSKCGRSHYWT